MIPVVHHEYKWATRNNLMIVFRYYRWREDEECEDYMKWCPPTCQVFAKFDMTLIAECSIANDQWMPRSAINRILRAFTKCHFIVPDVYIITKWYTPAKTDISSFISISFKLGRYTHVFSSIMCCCFYRCMYL